VDLERVTRLHTSLVFTLLLVVGVSTIWASLCAWRGRDSTERLRGLLWIGELLVIAECLLGVLLWLQGLRPARPEVHLIYGCVAVITIPLTLHWIRRFDGRRASLTLAIVGLFLCAILLRGIATGRP
jgi:hypothetical protein